LNLVNEGNGKDEDEQVRRRGLVHNCERDSICNQKHTYWAAQQSQKKKGRLFCRFGREREIQEIIKHLSKGRGEGRKDALTGTTGLGGDRQQTSEIVFKYQKESGPRDTRGHEPFRKGNAGG